MGTVASAWQSVRAAVRTGIFVLKVLPMLPSRPLDFVTPKPIVTRLAYATTTGGAEGDLYRPGSRGAHPGIVVCLGVVPFDVEHPQVPRLGAALARAGFAALLYWSPAMRDFRLDPEDIENIALAYGCLVEQPDIDARRSGLFGTCVGGSFALMAAASPTVRDRVAFVGAFAPYASLPALARDIVSSSCERDGERHPWQVDQLTRRVFVHSITAHLEPDEAQLLRDAYESAGAPRACDGLSVEGRAVHALLVARDPEEAGAALRGLPDDVRAGLTQLSPLEYVADLHAPMIAISHDRDDAVIPVGQSRRLAAALHGRAGLHYTEFAMFEHADPTKRKLSPVRLLWQLGKFYLWLHAVFRVAVR